MVPSSRRIPGTVGPVPMVIVSFLPVSHQVGEGDDPVVRFGQIPVGMDPGVEDGDGDAFPGKPQPVVNFKGSGGLGSHIEKSVHLAVVIDAENPFMIGQVADRVGVKPAVAAVQQPNLPADGIAGPFPAPAEDIPSLLLLRLPFETDDDRNRLVPSVPAPFAPLSELMNQTRIKRAGSLFKPGFAQIFHPLYIIVSAGKRSIPPKDKKIKTIRK